MILIHTLRMIVDLSIYFLFAEVIAVSFGGKSILLEMLLLSLCYGILIYIRKFSQSRIFLLIPVLFLFLPKTLGLSLVNRVILAASIFYIIYLIAQEKYGLSWDRQAELFSMSWKIFIGAGLLICLSGNYGLFLSYSVPMIFISLSASILLLRMLRHEPAVYLSRQYQTKNFLLLGFLLMLAWLSSRKFVLDTVLQTCNFIYTYCILPILMLVLNCVVFLIELCMKLFSWLKFGEVVFTENHLTPSESVNPFSEAGHVMQEQNDVFRIVLYVILFLLLIIGAILFFRWLISTHEKTDVISPEIDISRTKGSNLKQKQEYHVGSIQQVRKQYRKFLKLYKSHGNMIHLSDTSTDIAQKSSELLGTSEDLKEMREIYIKARYGNQATKADLKRIKQIHQNLQI